MILASNLASAHTLALFQQDMINSGNAKLLEIFVGITAFSFLVIAIVAIALVAISLKAKNEIMVHVLEIKAKAMPIIDKSSALLTDLTPPIKDITAKVNVITGHVGEIVVVAKDKAHEFSPTISEANVAVRDIIAKSKATFDDANTKVHEVLATARETVADANRTVLDTNKKTAQQIDRVNSMVSGVLDATVRLGHAIEQGIALPGREIAGFVNGAKTTIDSFMKKSTVAGNSAQHKAVELGAVWASKLAAMFAKDATPPARQRPTTPPPYRAPAQHNSTAPKPPINPYSSMANAAGSGTKAEMEPGVSSGSGGNGDPIVG